MLGTNGRRARPTTTPKSIAVLVGRDTYRARTTYDGIMASVITVQSTLPAAGESLSPIHRPMHVLACTRTDDWAGMGRAGMGDGVGWDGARLGWGGAGVGFRLLGSAGVGTA